MFSMKRLNGLSLKIRATDLHPLALFRPRSLRPLEKTRAFGMTPYLSSKFKLSHYRKFAGSDRRWGEHVTMKLTSLRGRK
jgi:hypothetical protein